MKKAFLLISIIVLFLVIASLRANNPANIISNLAKKGGIHPGELRYKIYLFGILPAGEAVIMPKAKEEYGGKAVYHLSATAKSSNALSGFFSGSVVLDSYIDAKILSPLAFKQKLSLSGRPEIDKEVIYDQGSGVMSIAGVERSILPNTQDPLSAIFNLRRMDFAKTKEFQMNINTNQKNYILTGSSQPKQLLIDKNLYKIVFIKAEVKRRDKNPYHKSDITLVLLEDKENLPILIKVFASGFLMNARLIETR